MSDNGQKPFVEVIAADPQLRKELLDLLQDSGLVKIDGNAPADLVCVGCDKELPVGELERALRYRTDTKHVPVVLMTCGGSEELAVEAFRQGVSEYIRVPFSRQQLEAALSSLNCRNKKLQSSCQAGLLGYSPAIQEIRAYLGKVAAVDSNVLITGETGTGKELVAQIVHNLSQRAQKPLVCINCAAVPETLFESELFGYERGAFTGAHTRQEGKLQLADGGTLFLDEIGEMCLSAQAKLLRVLESREIMRLGGRKAEQVDVRFFAATNGDLESLMHSGKFRSDLFFRLNVARVRLPALRERKEDILVLASFFREMCDRMFRRSTVGFSRQTEQMLLMYDWPGNARELRNVVEAAFIGLAPEVKIVDIPKLRQQALHGDRATGSSEFERIVAALAETRWNRSRAAKLLRWSRMTLYRKMVQYELPASRRPEKVGL